MIYKIKCDSQVSIYQIYPVWEIYQINQYMELSLKLICHRYSHLWIMKSILVFGVYQSGNCLHILYFSFKVKFLFLCPGSSTTVRKWLSDEEMKSLFSFSLSFSAQQKYLQEFLGLNGKLYLEWRHFKRIFISLATGAQPWKRF